MVIQSDRTLGFVQETLVVTLLLRLRVSSVLVNMHVSLASSARVVILVRLTLGFVGHVVFALAQPAGVDDVAGAAATGAVFVGFALALHALAHDVASSVGRVVFSDVSGAWRGWIRTSTTRILPRIAWEPYRRDRSSESDAL